MAPNTELIQYACIARSTTILGRHRASSVDPNIETLASQCIAEAPPNHSIFSHTLNHRTYTFLVDPPFLFFAIFDHNLLKPLQLRFLHRLRSNSRSFLHSQSDNDSDVSPFCFQSQFDSIFKDALDFESGTKNDSVSRSHSSDSKETRSVSTLPLLAKPAAEGMLLKKKKKRVMESNGGVANGGGSPDNKMDVCGGDGGDQLTGCDGRDFSVAVAKGSLVNDRHQKAKHIWKKQVWVVLLLDLFVCAVLFVIWLWVCSGFKCMAY